jgi:hypothetical protein
MRHTANHLFYNRPLFFVELNGPYNLFTDRLTLNASEILVQFKLEF